jgi:hypothetical protein
MERTAEIKYTEFWVIRIIKDYGNKKICIGEIEYSIPPTEQDIVEVLIDCATDEFISITHNYRMGGKR